MTNIWPQTNSNTAKEKDAEKVAHQYDEQLS